MLYNLTDKPLAGIRVFLHSLKVRDYTIEYVHNMKITVSDSVDLSLFSVLRIWCKLVTSLKLFIHQRKPHKFCVSEYSIVKNIFHIVYTFVSPYLIRTCGQAIILSTELNFRQNTNVALRHLICYTKLQGEIN